MTDYLVYQEDGKDYLVDTGSPVSFNQTANLKVLNEISSKLERPIAGVFGTDKIKQFKWHFDSSTQVLTKTNETKFSHYQAYDLGFYFGVPTIESSINDRPFTLFIDTCSTLNYLVADLLTGESTIETHEYHPFLGDFVTKGYQRELGSLGLHKPVIVHALPEKMRPAFTYKAKGIIGLPFFQDRDWIIDLARSTWWMKKD